MLTRAAHCYYLFVDRMYRLSFGVFMSIRSLYLLRARTGYFITKLWNRAVTVESLGTLVRGYQSSARPVIALFGNHC